MLDARIIHNHAGLCWHRFAILAFIFFLLVLIFTVCIYSHLDLHRTIRRMIHIRLVRGAQETRMAVSNLPTLRLLRLQLQLLLTHRILLVRLFIPEWFLGASHGTLTCARRRLVIIHG